MGHVSCGWRSLHCLQGGGEGAGGPLFIGRVACFCRPGGFGELGVSRQKGELKPSQGSLAGPFPFLVLLFRQLGPESGGHLSLPSLSGR